MAASLSGVSGTSLSDRLNYRRKRKRKTVGEIGRVGHHGKQDSGHLDWDHSDEERENQLSKRFCGNKLDWQV